MKLPYTLSSSCGVVTAVADALDLGRGGEARGEFKGEAEG